MAKGDHARVDNTILEQGNKSQGSLSNLNSDIYSQYQNLDNHYRGAAFQNTDDYSGMMGNYQNFLNQNSGAGGSGSNGGVGGLHRQGEINSALAGYGDFAKTGGFTPQGIQDIRARSIAPTRAVYSNMQNEMARQKSLQGGYSPNFMAASAKMARQGGQAIGDMNVNANAGIAQMVQQGRLAGLGGLSQTALADQAQGLQRGIASAQMGMQNKGMNLDALRGMTALYGTTPGLSSMFGNQMQNASGQLLQGQGLQQQLSNMIINGKLGMSQVPGNFQSTMGNISSVLGLGGQIGGVLGGLGGLGGGNTGFAGGMSQMPNQSSPIGQVSFPSMPNFGGQIAGITAPYAGSNVNPNWRF